MNLTDTQLATLLDALEQWEDGMDIEMQGDELAEARKDIQALRGVLVGTHTMNNLNTQDIKLLRPIVELYASDHEHYMLSTDYGVKFGDEGPTVARADFTYLREIREVQTKLNVNI